MRGTSQQSALLTGQGAVEPSGWQEEAQGPDGWSRLQPSPRFAGTGVAEPRPGPYRGYSWPTPTLRPCQASELASPAHGVCAEERESREVRGAGSGDTVAPGAGVGYGSEESLSLEEGTVMAVQVFFRSRTTGPGSGESLLDPLLWSPGSRNVGLKGGPTDQKDERESQDP